MQVYPESFTSSRLFVWRYVVIRCQKVSALAEPRRLIACKHNCPGQESVLMVDKGLDGVGVLDGGSLLMIVDISTLQAVFQTAVADHKGLQYVGYRRRRHSPLLSLLLPIGGVEVLWCAVRKVEFVGCCLHKNLIRLSLQLHLEVTIWLRWSVRET